MLGNYGNKLQMSSHSLGESIFPHFDEEKPLIITHRLAIEFGDIDACEDDLVPIFARLRDGAA